jgi:uncharacterized membrane protein
MTLIVCFLSFTTLAQNDSTYCFTKSQVKVFLTTKVELNNCNELYNDVKAQNKAITDTLNVLTIDNTKQKRKVKRNRIIAISGISAFFSTLLLLFIIK